MVKRPILALMMMGMMTMPAWAVGTVTQSLNTLGAQNWVLAINWTGDATTGTVPTTVMQSAQIIQGYRVFAVEIAPGSPAPTNLYTVTLTTFLGVDVLGGGGASLSNSVAAALQVPATAPPVNGALTFNLSGNSVAGAKGNILVYFAPISQVTGLLAPTGPSLTGNNLFSGNTSFSGTSTFSGPVNSSNTNTFSGTNTLTGPTITTQLNGCQIVDASQTFAQALAAATNPGCIEITPGTYTVAVNSTIPAGVQLVSKSGGLLSIATTVTLTINGTIVAPPQQLFVYNGTGAAVIGLPQLVYVAWFPGANGGAQINNCLAAAAGATCDARSLTGTQTSTALSTIGIGQTVLLGPNLWTSAAAAGMFAFTATGNFATSQAGTLRQDPGGVLQYTGSGAAINLAPGAAGNFINGATIDIDTLDGNAVGNIGVQFGGAGWVQRTRFTFKHLWHFTGIMIDMQLGRKNGTIIQGGDIDGSNLAASATNSTNCLLMEDSSAQTGYNLYEGNYFTLNNIRNCLLHVSFPIQANANYVTMDSNFDYVSQANVNNGNTTISNVPNISNWTTGDQIWESTGSIPAGTTVTVSGANLILSAAPTATVPNASLFNPKYNLMTIKGTRNTIVVTGLNPTFQYNNPATGTVTQPFFEGIILSNTNYGQDNIISVPPQFFPGMGWLPKTQSGVTVPFDSVISTTPPTHNLLINGSFENVDTPYPIGWTSTQLSAAGDHTDIGMFGIHSISPVSNANQVAYLSQALPGNLNGKTVTGCAAIRWQSGTAGTVGVALNDGAGETFAPLAPQTAIGNGDPGNFYYTCVSRTLGASPNFRIYVQHTSGTTPANTLFVDGAGVYMGTTPAWPSDTEINNSDIFLQHVNGSNSFFFNSGQITAQPCTSTLQRTETGADANLLTCAIPAIAGSYRIRFALSLSAANAATLGWTATWTDSNGNAQTPTNLSLFQEGTAGPALTFTTSAAGNYYGYADIDVNNAGTSIVVKLTFSGTSFTGKASATVERII